MLKTAVALLLAAAAFTLSAVALAQESPPEAPQGVELRMRDGVPLITWLSVTGADTYEVRESFCASGSRTNCAIASTKETGWQGPAAAMPEGRYLVAACNNNSGCGEAVHPVLVDDRPEAPEQVSVEQTPDGVLVSWTPVDDAIEYQVIFHDHLSRMCHLEWPEQELVQCQEAGRTADTRFLHRSRRPVACQVLLGRSLQPCGLPQGGKQRRRDWRLHWAAITGTGSDSPTDDRRRHGLSHLEQAERQRGREFHRHAGGASPIRRAGDFEPASQRRRAAARDLRSRAGILRAELREPHAQDCRRRAR